MRFDDVSGRSSVAVEVPPPDRAASEREAAPTTVACAAVGVRGADFFKDGASEDGTPEDGTSGDGVLDVGAACSGSPPVGCPRRSGGVHASECTVRPYDPGPCPVADPSVVADPPVSSPSPGIACLPLRSSAGSLPVPSLPDVMG